MHKRACVSPETYILSFPLYNGFGTRQYTRSLILRARSFAKHLDGKKEKKRKTEKREKRRPNDFIIWMLEAFRTVNKLALQNSRSIYDIH